MSTDCTLCGKCCMNLGPYIIIDRKITPRDRYCRCTLTGEKFFAHIDGDDLTLFEHDARTEENKKACPFLRKKGDLWFCTIYRTRPQHCRTFTCKK